MESRKKVLFIVSQLSQPRCIRRIMAFKDAGYECVVYGYNRNKYNCNALPPDIKVNILGTFEDGTQYFSKVKKIRKDVKEIISVNGKTDVVYYSFGLLFTLFLYLNKVPYIYEISDILYGYPKFSIVLGLLKAMDKRFINKSVMTVMTSEGFKEFYGIYSEKIVVQPNKLNYALLNIPRHPLSVKKGDGLVFAFVGAFRYLTILRFAEVIGKYYPQHSFHFYGQAYGEDYNKWMELTKEHSNVKYFGEYKNPSDLERVYSGIDLVVSCYTASSLNEQLAEPNKLYESMFFCKPIIVSDGIFLSNQVKKMGCGFSIDASEESSIVKFIEELDASNLNEISNREFAIPSLELIDNPRNILDVFERVGSNNLN